MRYSSLFGISVLKAFFAPRKLETQVHYTDDGRDVDVETVKKIRRDLHLDDIHGVDSHSFYDKDPEKAQDFIARYRKTLYRLASL